MEGRARVEEEIAEVGTSTARMTSFLLAGKLIAFFIAALSLVVVARILGPSGYGVYVIAIAVAGVAGSVGNFGIGTALTKFISEYKSKREQKRINTILSDGIAILVVAGSIFTILTFLLAGPASYYALHGYTYLYVIQVASLMIIISILSGSLYSALIGFGYGAYSALYSVICIVVQSSVSISLALLGFGPIAPVLGVILGQFFGFLFAIYAIYWKGNAAFSMPTIAGMKRLFSFSGPVAVSNFFAAVVNDFSVIFLGIFVVSSVIGNFGIASRTNFLGDIVVGSIGLAMLPGFTRFFSRNRTREDIGRFYNKALYVSFVVASPFMFFLIFFAKPVSSLAFGGTYALAPLFIVIAAIGILISIFGNYSGTMLISDNRTRDIMKYRGYMFVIQLILMFIMIYLFQGFGLAVLVFIIGPLLQAFFYIRRIRFLYRIKTEHIKIFRVILSNVASFAVVYMLLLWLANNYVYLVPAAMVGIVILYPIVLVAFGGMDKDDASMLRGLSKSMPVAGRLLSIIVSYSEAFMR